MGHVHPTVVFRDPSGFKLSNQAWVKAKCNTNQLATVLLKQHRTKIEGTPEGTIKKHFGFTPASSDVLIMPSFNDFLGGRAMNETRPGKEGQATMIGPMLRSGMLDLDNAEIYMLDGTYLGTLAQLRRI
jgi:metallophosphoesterase superfamily enzyme